MERLNHEQLEELKKKGEKIKNIASKPILF